MDLWAKHIGAADNVFAENNCPAWRRKSQPAQMASTARRSPARQRSLSSSSDSSLSSLTSASTLSSSGRWRSSRQSPRRAAKCNPAVGDIIFIGAENQHITHDASIDIPSTARMHPALISEIDERANIATVEIITSFQDKTIEEKYMTTTSSDTYRQHINEYLPIFPAKSPIKGLPPLRLQNGEILLKNSYLKISEQWQVSLDDIEPFRARTIKYRLTKESADIAFESLKTGDARDAAAATTIRAEAKALATRRTSQHSTLTGPINIFIKRDNENRPCCAAS